MIAWNLVGFLRINPDKFKAVPFSSVEFVMFMPVWFNIDSLRVRFAWGSCVRLIAKYKSLMTIRAVSKYPVKFSLLTLREWNPSEMFVKLAGDGKGARSSRDISASAGMASTKTFQVALVKLYAIAVGEGEMDGSTDGDGETFTDGSGEN